METPALTVDAVVRYPDGRFVLVKRKYGPFKGWYSLPGGYVEIGETVEAACRREIREETGLEVTDVKLQGVYSSPDRAPDHHVVTIAFQVTVCGGTLRPGDDASDVLLCEDPGAFSLAFDHNAIITDYQAGAGAAGG